MQNSHESKEKKPQPLKILGIFAHPDDETFGPAGTFIKYTQAGHQIFVISATSGQAGQSSDKHIQGSLGEHRIAEMHQAAKIMGINPPIVLDFFDGTLNEHQLPLLMKEIAKEVSKINPDIIIVYEKGGISYHLDHIAVTKAVLSLFDSNRISPAKIYYFGLDPEVAGMLERETTLNKDKLTQIDITDLWELKKEAMQAHKSQEKDFLRLIKRNEELRVKNSGRLYETFSLARTSLDHTLFSYPETDLLKGLIY